MLWAVKRLLMTVDCPAQEVAGVCLQDLNMPGAC
jgi:hypothetical protein